MLLKNFTTVSFYTALSRISGFARDIIMARYLGAGPLSDAFLIALRVPNFFRRFFAEGALNTAFIPLFSRKLEGEGKEAARKMAEEVFVFLFVILLVFSVLFMLFMPYLIVLIAPGLTLGDSHIDKDLVVKLTRITFPYLFFISIATLFSGILNSLSKFASVSFMPVLFNLALILSMLLFSQRSASIVYSLSWGVFYAGILQVLWMIYFLYKNKFLIDLKFKFLKVTDNVREFFRKLLPTALGGRRGADKSLGRSDDSIILLRRGNISILCR
jgi:putative peptidoglycan lipid II flippase